MSKRKSIVVIGGGTGSFTVLSSLKNEDLDVTALVNMADDGGSTGLLRDEYGVLPPGDIRQCLVALSQAPSAVRELFNFRFPGDSSLGGHSFGNLFLSATEMMTNNFGDAVKIAAEVLNIKGHVYPMTLDECQLIMKHKGKEIVGQSAVVKIPIDSNHKPDFSLTPKAKINPEAKQAILSADLVIIAPGDLYGSIVPALLVDELASSLAKTKSKLLYICNLVNKPLNTNGFSVDNYVSEIERFIGSGSIDMVLYNVDMPSEEQLNKYALDKEYPVVVDEEKLKAAKYQAIPGNFLSHKDHKRDKNDTLLERSLIRHDTASVARAIVEVLR